MTDDAEQPLKADYLVVGAGAMGFAFTDEILTGSPDATVLMIDSAERSGGHWIHAYPFVRLHQASAFYGVASTLLGSGAIQAEGPEAGLHERANAADSRIWILCSPAISRIFSAMKSVPLASSNGAPPFSGSYS